MRDSESYKLTDPFTPMNVLVDASAATAGETYSPNAWVANVATYHPIILPVSATIYSVSALFANATGNYDIGLYNEDMTKYQSSGSQAITAVQKTLTLTHDFRARAGVCYWMALAVDNSGSSVVMARYGAAGLAIAGAAQQASAFTLPSTMTPASPSQNLLPYMTLGIR